MDYSKRYVKRTVCPKCGSKITVSFLYQSSKNYFIKQDGKLSKAYTTDTWMPLEVSVAACSNPDCDVHWDEDDFILHNHEFLDRKY